MPSKHKEKYLGAILTDENSKKLLSGAEVDNSLKAGSVMGSVVKGLFKK